MKRFILTIAIIFCLGGAAFAVLKITGFGCSGNSASGGSENEPAFYVSFMDDFFILDADGIVLECTSVQPVDIPAVENMMFESFIVGKTADAASESMFEYVRKVCALLESYELSAEYISAEDGELTIYLTDTLGVVLGENDDTDLKIKDLKSLYPNLSEYEGGILYMQNADTSGQGYTFKQISSDDDE